MGSVSLSGLSIVVVRSADEAAVRQWYELRCAVVRADQPGDPLPCWRNELGRMRHPWPGHDQHVWLARIGDVVVGGAELGLPTLDNLSNAVGDVLVAPEYRRGGIGQALLAHLRAEASAAGRIRLTVDVEHPLDGAVADPARRFAEMSGAVLALEQTRRRLDLASVVPDVLTDLERQARARAQGYSLVQWTGAAPQRWLDDLAYLTGRMSLDEPLDDLRWDRELFDAQRVRGQDASLLARGLRRVTTGAVHDRSAKLVAFTQIGRCATTGWYGGQWFTIVAPEHRGHRLGTLVKLANLDYALVNGPELRVIDTWNADSNRYMVSINEAMGFRPHSRAGQWQLDL
ncbi:MAG TPA: GNAT family N-acetyltransferase [Pseudonocardiaceae bacterium]|jgi:GNAT superfamily N-acetyltransferase